MIPYVNEIKEITNSKENIVWAISMSIANGDENLAKELYPIFKESIMNNTTVFFADVKNFESTYELEKKELIKKFSDFLGYDVSGYINGEVKIARTVYGYGFNNVDPKIIEMYEKNERTYLRYGITKARFVDLYLNKGKEGINELNSYVKLVKKKLAFSWFKDFISRRKEIKKVPIMNARFEALKDKYGIDNIDDLLTLNTEIDSFFIDESILDEKEKEIVRKNRGNFKRRLNKDDSYVLTLQEASALKKEILEVYNFHLYRQAFEKTNIRDFFKYYEYEYSADNLKHMFSALGTISNASALCNHHDYGDGKGMHCMFGAGLLEKSSAQINNVVLHEFIHSLENQNPNDKVFWKEYRNVNEAITEYLAKRGMKYLNGDVMPSRKDNKDEEAYKCAYDNMLPLVKTLEESPYWKDFLDAKFNGNVKKLEQKIGRLNALRIEYCFISCHCLDYDDTSSQQIYVDQLNRILKRIEKRERK